jgi:hypothetical protein
LQGQEEGKQSLPRTERTMIRQHHSVRAFLALACAVVLAAFTASAASAAEVESFGIESLSAGVSNTEAGAHPDFTTTFAINGNVRGTGYALFESAKFGLPPGLIGNPTAFPECPVTQFLRGPTAQCPIGSQVGTVRLNLQGIGEVFEPVFNLPPGPDEPARLGFVALYFPMFINIGLRPGDYSVTATTIGSNANSKPLEVETTLWGDPSDPIHDEQRRTPEEAGFDCPGSEVTCEVPGGRSAGLPLTAFMSNSTACQAQEVFLGITSYSLPGQEFSATTPLGATTNCERPPFKPSLEVEPTNQVAGAPTGLNVVLRIAQTQSPGLPSSADLRRSVVTLPPGMTISAGAGDGLAACSAEQVGVGTDQASACPNAAKVGSAEFVSPDLPATLKGSIYQRTPEAGNLFQVWLVSDEFGVHLKLPGVIKADPQTGQLTATFDETPQLPVEEIKLEFKGGPRAPLKNPASCGTYEASYTLTPWSSGAPVTGVSKMTIDEGCGGGSFSPKLSAGTENPVGGSYSPLLLSLTRQDGEQNIQRLTATLPRGLLAKLAGVPLCPDSAAGSGACPSGSQIGTVNVASGTGSNPLWLPQPGKAPTAVYLAGPYKGGPYSLVVKVPAQAGPFDLGTVAVRTALQINPSTTQVTAESDPLPQILEGVPIWYRNIDVNVNRPEFALNPTNCEPQAVEGTVVSSSGATATPQSRFQVGDCSALAFSPTLKLSLSGQVKRTGNPALKAVLTQPAGNNSNITGTSVILPKGTFIDQSHINNPCTRVQFNENKCPAKSMLGTAKAWSPLLERPLEGPVYFRSNGGERKLPDLVADLNGQIHVVLVGFIDSIKQKGSESSRVRTRFQSVPDAPVSRFQLQLYGGKRGLIENSQNLCSAGNLATLHLTGQNGKVDDKEVKVAVKCGHKQGGK